MDEIDFEFLGHDKCAVQTNFHVAGGGGREQIHRLPFDSSDGFHHYAIAWGAEAIEWRIDGELIRRDERVAGEPWPEKPMFLYASVWDASHINDGKWTGTYHGRDAPYVCSYKDIRVPLALSLEEVEDPYQCATAGDAPAATAAADAVEKVDADVPAATTAADAVDAGDASAMRLLPPPSLMLWMPGMRLLLPPMLWMQEMRLLPPPPPMLWKGWTPELVKIRSLGCTAVV
uniref:GH16 domain-containing protein n=1 Tax=Oryza brachyantha TaxID=4533 RepID=J3LJA9_ORYBR